MLARAARRRRRWYDLAGEGAGTGDHDQLPVAGAADCEGLVVCLLKDAHDVGHLRAAFGAGPPADHDSLADVGGGEPDLKPVAHAGQLSWGVAACRWGPTMLLPAGDDVAGVGGGDHHLVDPQVVVEEVPADGTSQTDQYTSATERGASPTPSILITSTCPSLVVTRAAALARRPAELARKGPRLPRGRGENSRRLITGRSCWPGPGESPASPPPGIARSPGARLGLRARR
jgi:hypothetical protein